MGNETNCTVKMGGQKSEGKALLETSELIFRGGEFRLKIAIPEIKSVQAVNGELRIAFPEGNATFVLGPLAEKWAKRILHPKTVMEKLEVKAESTVALAGTFDDEFHKELRGLTTKISKGEIAADADSVFLSAESRKELKRVKKIAKAMKGATALWVVYPKGLKTISENDVLAAGREAGLKDVKVVGFSNTHTALKFMIPISQR
ncbi:MAG TPA: hypothetical protein VN982_08035 [Candidatus Dormibacteraeota bacterium]|nr:hypothetical protein [Candidatus Dormibacteraeota bacterium]